MRNAKRVRVARPSVRRVAAKDGIDLTGEALPPPPKRPSQCRTYMQKMLTREFQGIVEGFVKQAKSGSCQHVKLATELLDGRRRQVERKRTGRSSLKRLIQQMEQVKG